MTDYNDGKWHGWNGGECPVHPESFVHWVSRSGSSGKTNAEALRWSSPNSTIVAFRVVKPYVEPKEYSGECYAYHYANFAPSLAETKLNNPVRGKWTATHIDGKIAKITWKAIE